MQVLANIDVADLEQAIAFYGAALGLEVGRRFGTFAVEMVGGSSPIFLLEKAEGTVASSTSAQVRDYTRHWTPVHLDFVVDDVVIALERAVAAGARLEGEIRIRKWGRIAQLADPFGHGLCLIEFSERGYDEIAES